MRSALFAMIACLALAGCQPAETPTGTVQLNLVGRAPSGVAYRLRRGNIVVQGPSTTRFWDTEANLDETSLSEDVAVGHYSAFLQEGWFLERVAADGSGAPVTATLISANPIEFDVAEHARVSVPIRFRVAGGEVAFEQGYDITIEVEEGGTTGAICSSNGDCASGETCCVAGFFGTCHALAPGASCPLPDLTISAEAAASSMRIEHRVFAPTSCALVEGCVNAPGDRRLLSFSTQTPNIGAADLVLGDPTMQPGFEFSECHGHYHFEGYANYELLDSAGNIAATGHKQAFCLLDLAAMPGTTTSPRFNCGFQGISAGWSDVYGAGLDCQWVDITGVPAGNYTLRVTVNGDRTLPESDYSNNTIEVPVTITEDGTTMPGDPLAPCATAINGPARDCGWQIAAPAQSCMPGTPVTVGCGCMTGRACDGDPMLRVCAGEGPCTQATLVGQVDDSCSSRCPELTFTCPESGIYTVLTGGYLPGEQFTCDAVAPL